MRPFDLAGSWLRVAAGVIALVATAWLVAQWSFGLMLLDVQTNSMVPTFRPADALVLSRRNGGDLRIGDIVSYHSSRNPNELVTHRIVALDGESFQTKGDAVSSADPPVRDRLLTGRVVAILPGLGHVLRWSRSFPGLLLCIYLPAAILTVAELRRLERHYGRLSPYRLYGRQVV